MQIYCDKSVIPKISVVYLLPEIHSLHEQQCECRRRYKQESMEYHEQKQMNRELQQKREAEQKREQTRLSKISADRAR